MNFLQPWALGLGAAALLLPVVVHFLTRPRPQSMPLSTIRFVQQAVKQRRRQNWLRDVLVLLLRTSAIGCIAWAFARPTFIAQPQADNVDSSGIHRIVMLDASQSMAAAQSGVDRFQSARVQALSYLKPSPGLRANLIVAAATADAVFETPSTNMAALADALAKTSSKPERLDVQAAINAAAQMSIATPESDVTRQLIIISDFQRTNWATVDFSALPESTIIKLESIAPVETPDNISILNVGFSEKPTAGTQANLEVTVGNYSKNARNISVQVALDDSVFVVQQVCPPNVQTVISKSVMFRKPGWQTGSATVLNNEDALAADDVFPFVVQAIDTPNATLITRQLPHQRPSSSYFLERALSPYEDQRSGNTMKVDRVGPARFNSDTVAASQILIFDHPGRLEANQIQLLASLIRRGRGALYIASEPVDATNLKLLYEELGSDLQAPVDLMPPPPGANRKSLTISRVQQDRRPFHVFGTSLSAMLADLKFSGGLATQRVPDSLDDDVLATLSDQSVLLFTSPAGLGNLCVMNADLTDTNFPRHPTFVPVLNELVEGLLRSGNRNQSTFCGEPLVRLLPTSVTSTENLQIVQAEDAGQTKLAGDREVNNGKMPMGELQPSGQGVVWNWKHPDGPGTFRVIQNQQTVYALASHIPPDESDLRSLDAQVMVQRLSGGKNVSFHYVSETKNNKDDSWIWFAVASVIALIGEIIVLKRFRM